VLHLRDFEPKTLENRAALRTAIATLAAILIAFALHVDKPYWSGMTVVILANIYTGSIIDKALMRLSGAIVGAWFGFFIAGFIANSFILYLLVNFLLVAFAVYYYNFSQYAYAYLLAALSAFIVISELAINPDEAFLVAIWRPIDIGIGVIVSAASAFCLFPNSIHDNVIKEINSVFDSLTSLLDQLNRLLSENDVSLVPPIKQNNLQLKKKIRKAAEMIGFMRRELGFDRNKIDRFRLLLDSCFDLCRAISYFMSSNQFSTASTSGTVILIDQLFSALHNDLLTLNKAFLIKQDKISLETPLIIKQFDIALISINDRTSDFLAIAYFLRQINHMVINLSVVLTTTQLKQTNKQKMISAKQQLRNDPDIIVHGIKAGMAAVLALVFWLLSNWPGGLNGIISSIVISIRKNLFEMKNISIHRVLGCMAGGGLVLTILTFFSMDLYLLVLLIFFAVWAFSYFSFKEVNYAYIGLQANIALVITLAQAGGPPVDLAPPLERLGGVFIGITASFLVANLIWRTDLLSMLNRQLQKLKRDLLINLEHLLIPDGKKLSDLTNAFWVCRGLLESLANMKLNSTKEQVLGKAKAIHIKLVLQHAAINHIAHVIDQESAHKVAGYFNVNLKKIEADIIGLYTKNPHPDNAAIMEEIDSYLEKLMQNLQNPDISTEDIENSIAYINSLKQLVNLFN